MIHTLESLPFVTFTQIAKTENLNLLLTRKFKFSFIRDIYVKWFKINLTEQWTRLGEEYSKHEDSKKATKITQLQNKLRKLYSQYYPIIAALEVLRYGEDAEMLELIKTYGYKIEGEYWEGLAIIFKQLENRKNKIEGVKNEISTLLEHGKSKDEINVYETLTNLALGLEMNMSLTSISTIEYVFYKKALLKKIEQNNKK